MYNTSYYVFLFKKLGELIQFDDFISFGVLFFYLQFTVASSKGLVYFQNFFVDSWPTLLGQIISESVSILLSRYNSRYCTHQGSSI